MNEDSKEDFFETGTDENGRTQFRHAKCESMAVYEHRTLYSHPLIIAPQVQRKAQVHNPHMVPHRHPRLHLRPLLYRLFQPAQPSTLYLTPNRISSTPSTATDTTSNSKASLNYGLVCLFSKELCFLKRIYFSAPCLGRVNLRVRRWIISPRR